MLGELAGGGESTQTPVAPLRDGCMEAFARITAASVLSGEEPNLQAAYIAAGFAATERATLIAQSLWEDEDIQARIAVLVQMAKRTSAKELT